MSEIANVAETDIEELQASLSKFAIVAKIEFPELQTSLWENCQYGRNPTHCKTCKKHGDTY